MRRGIEQPSDVHPQDQTGAREKFCNKNSPSSLLLFVEGVVQRDRVCGPHRTPRDYVAASNSSVCSLNRSQARFTCVSVVCRFPIARRIAYRSFRRVCETKISPLAFTASTMAAFSASMASELAFEWHTA